MPSLSRSEQRPLRVAIAGLGFGRVEGALRSAEALAARLQTVATEKPHSEIKVQPN